LTGDDEDAAQKAVKRLYELLVSKRAENTAAAAAVPFLVERMLVPTNRAHNTLLLLIADIANGPGAERDAVIAALPSLRHFTDEEHPGNIRWAANELITICESCAGGPAQDCAAALPRAVSQLIERGVRAPLCAFHLRGRSFRQAHRLPVSAWGRVHQTNLR
jgi:hypothetical protein